MRTLILQTHDTVRDIPTVSRNYEWSNESVN